MSDKDKAVAGGERVAHVNYPFKTGVDTDATYSMADGMRTVLDGLMPAWEDNPSTQNTPMRFVKYLAEYSQPLDIDKIFGSTFDVEEKHPSMIIQHPIPFRMMCEHHLLPATGSAAIGYVPNDKVIGLSKLTRLVDAVGVEKPSLQEHISDRIMNLMIEHLKPKGVVVVISGEHGCMACRGVNRAGVRTTTSSVHGVFRDVPSARQEFLSLIGTKL